MRDLLPYLALYRRHKWRLAFGILLAIITLLASIGLLTLSGWFLSASALIGLSGIYFNYMLPAAGVRAGAIIRTAGRYCERLVSHDATFRVLEHLRVSTFRKLLPLSPAGLARFQQGELLNRMVADVDTLDHLYLRVISPLTGAFVVIVVVTLGLSILDMTAALTLGGIMLATLILLPPFFYRAGQAPGRLMTEQRGHYRQQLTAWLQGHAELTLFGAESRYRQQLELTEQRWQQAQYQQASLTALSQALMLLISGAAVITMLWLVRVAVDGGHTASAVIALFVFCALAAFEALAPVTGAFQHLGQVIASARRVSQITHQMPAISFPETGAVIDTPVSLSIRHLNFTYPEQTSSVLKDISLSVAPGQHVALLGTTGCGKSTLLQLLTRAWHPDSGEILLNDQPLSSFDETTLRRTMGVVSQRVHIFSATLRDNLLLASPQASDDTLKRILEHTGLAKLLEDDGLDAWLGEGGRPLSGGEQRRIAVARALLHDAPLLLLDEPTEGLDAETEHQILDLIHTASAGKTVVMVTHRLQDLQHFDNIVVMDSGRIAEQGTHQALMACQGRYYQFRKRV